MPDLRLTLALLVALSPVRVWALDPARAEILTLRLGMTRAEVIANLTAQGTRIAPGDGPIEARTKDGELRIGLEPGGHVREIVYRFTGRGPNEAAAVREAVLEQFGIPSNETPLSWCRATRTDGSCPPGDPILTFGQQTSRLQTVLLREERA